MKALILAAGEGLRLRPLTENKPKALVEVGGVKLVDHVFRFLKSANVDQIACVVGYRSDRMRDHLKKYPEVKIYQNDEYKKGNIFTLTAAKAFLDDTFLIMNIDHIYPSKMMLHIVGNRMNGVTAICDFDRTLGADDMKIEMNGAKKITAISKTLDDFDGGYIGMTLCDKGSLPRYNSAIDKAISDFGDKAVVENILAELTDTPEGVDVCDASGFGWLEIDNVNELNSAEEFLKNNPGFLT